jgi:hypothetical protein
MASIFKGPPKPDSPWGVGQPLNYAISPVASTQTQPLPQIPQISQFGQPNVPPVSLPGPAPMHGLDSKGLMALLGQMNG